MLAGSFDHLVGESSVGGTVRPSALGVELVVMLGFSVAFKSLRVAETDVARLGYCIRGLSFGA